MHRPRPESPRQQQRVQPIQPHRTQRYVLYTIILAVLLAIGTALLFRYHTATTRAATTTRETLTIDSYRGSHAELAESPVLSKKLSSLKQHNFQPHHTDTEITHLVTPHIQTSQTGVVFVNFFMSRAQSTNICPRRDDRASDESPRTLEALMKEIEAVDAQKREVHGEIVEVQRRMEHTVEDDQRNSDSLLDGLLADVDALKKAGLNSDSQSKKR